MTGLLAWLQGLISQALAALVHGWRADEALRDQGETAALEASRAREAERKRESLNAEREAGALAPRLDDAALDSLLRDEFGPGRK